MYQMDRGVGERQAARDDEVRGRKTQHGQHNELAAPAGSRVFQQARSAAAIGRATYDIPIDRQRQQECDEYDPARGDGSPWTRRLSRDRWQVSKSAEIVDTDEAQY